MARVPLLKVDAEGNVVAQNAAARDLLGPAVGRPCCEAVAATEEGVPSCSSGCARHLLSAGESQDLEGVEVHGAAGRLACSAMGDEVVVAIVPTGSETPENPLTPREREVVSLIADGLTNARIAKRLRIPPSTVRTHIERLLDKLGARSRAEAVSRAIVTGQLHPS